MAKQTKKTSSIIVGDGSGLPWIKVTRAATVEDAAEQAAHEAAELVHRATVAALGYVASVNGAIGASREQLREALS